MNQLVILGFFFFPEITFEELYNLKLNDFLGGVLKGKDMSQIITVRCKLFGKHFIVLILQCAISQH